MMGTVDMQSVTCPQTGFQKKGVSQQYDYASRRAALRASWFPSSREALAKVAQKDGLIVRFVIGHTLEARQEEAVALEDANYGGFLRLPIRVPMCHGVIMCPSLAAPCHLRELVSCLHAGRLRHLDHQDPCLPDDGHADVRCKVHCEGVACSYWPCCSSCTAEYLTLTVWRRWTTMSTSGWTASVPPCCSGTVQMLVGAAVVLHGSYARHAGATDAVDLPAQITSAA